MSWLFTLTACFPITHGNMAGSYNNNNNRYKSSDEESKITIITAMEKYYEP